MKTLILALFFLIPCLVLGGEPNPIPPAYQPLVDRLSRDGFDFEFLSKLFTDNRAEIIPERMMVSLGSVEMGEWYTKFLTSESILLARNFLGQNLKFLKRVERQSKVDKEVIVAILLVESRFGENTGRHRVIPTLASMAVMETPDNLQTNYLILREIDPELSYEWVAEKASRRANWAYHELKCFLTIIRDEKLDPLEVKGSYAGALGMCQFIPSSYLAYAKSQKGLESWLLSKEEAILSIANYLSIHGWKKRMPMDKKKKILWYYNHSEPYIDTVINVAQTLKDK
jgi:membrane-bound lytic murein transglycosylase B